MLDSYLRPFIDPPLSVMAKYLSKFGISPDQITWAGFLIGMAGAVSLSFQFYILALILILINRLYDGLDGALARILDQKTDLGGYLDIVLDFIFYSGIIFGFAIGHPEQAVAAAFLIFSFMGTGSSFLAYAIIAGKRNMVTEARGKKSFFHTGGLSEGTETIITLCLICLIPVYFQWIAIIYGGMCWLTTAGRIKQAIDEFEEC